MEVVNVELVLVACALESVALVECFEPVSEGARVGDGLWFGVF